MPKARRSFEFTRKARASPFPYSSSSSSGRQSSQNSSEAAAGLKEWEEARCPVCMEHPHNAVLLLCSSQNKGCRPYMCDTSYRHSNCLDQFRKAFAELLPPSMQVPSDHNMTRYQETHSVPSPANEDSPLVDLCKGQEQPKMSCPLCRGEVNGWVVVDPARRFMNSKVRSCSCETCDFSGTYSELRKHARVEHPLARPTDVDPERERKWKRMELERDMRDVISTLESGLDEFIFTNIFIYFPPRPRTRSRFVISSRGMRLEENSHHERNAQSEAGDTLDD